MKGPSGRNPEVASGNARIAAPIRKRFGIVVFAAVSAASLSSCGKDVSDADAQQCIQNAATNSMRASDVFSFLASKDMNDFNKKRNTATVSDAKVVECKKTGPASYVCAVEYKVSMGGMGAELIGALAKDKNATKDMQVLKKWEFTKGDSVISCSESE